MIFQDHSLVFFSSISMKHALSWAVRSKKRKFGYPSHAHGAEILDAV
jgi:hypothetical protein